MFLSCFYVSMSNYSEARQIKDGPRLNHTPPVRSADLDFSLMMPLRERAVEWSLTSEMKHT